MEAKVPTDRPLGLSDIKPFEDLLDVNIMVLSSKTGNKLQARTILIGTINRVTPATL
jgi:hypothetical protein